VVMPSKLYDCLIMWIFISSMSTDETVCSLINTCHTEFFSDESDSALSNIQISYLLYFAFLSLWNV